MNTSDNTVYYPYDNNWYSPYKYYQPQTFTWTVTKPAVTGSKRVLRYLEEVKRDLTEEVLEYDEVDCEELQADLDAVKELIEEIKNK